jgi:alpha-beta hydrolase superfamily lysophospholipase
MPIQFEHFGGTNGRRLFFLVHGMDRTAADLAPLKAAIRASFPDDRLVMVTYPASRWSNQNPLDVAKHCVDRIQSEFESGPEGGYQEIVLVGHSLGALIARKVCLLAHGICSDFAAGIPVTPAPRTWANKIKRLVLLAGMSRGWKLWPRNQHTPRLRWIGRGLQFGLARIFGQGRLVRAAHRGSPFVVNLRLDWLALINGDYAKEMPPDLVVQIAALRDTMVHPSDHFDLQAGRNFRYVPVEGTSHNALVQFDDAEHGPERKRKFLHALSTPPEEFVSEWNTAGVAPPNPDVTQVILLAHGIRDYGKWQEDLRIQLHDGASQRHLMIDTSILNYGYLPLLPFLFGAGRTIHIERLMDRYAEMRSRYPKASCSFAGHSNGTYLLASALRRYRASRFARVAFMGSIVQRNFPWLHEFESRVGEVRNHVASADWVVAIFPSLFEMIRLLPLMGNFPLNRDFGSAGHTGFTQANDSFVNVAYIDGSHGAALKPEHRESLVSFLLGDAPEARIMPKVVNEYNGWVDAAHKVCVLIWIAILAAGIFLFRGSELANHWLGWQPWILPAVVLLWYFFALFTL